MTTLFDRVKVVVVNQLKVDAEEVRPDSSLVDDLHADSLDIVDLTIAIEEEFATDSSFEIRDEDAENIKTVQDILDFLETHGVK